MGIRQVPARARWPVTAAAVAVLLGATGGGVTGTASRPLPQPSRARAFVDTFDRMLIAGFVAGHVSDRGHDLDINEESARLLRMTLGSQGGLDVIESQPLELRRSEGTGETEDAIFTDVPFWKRLGEEYREPLILTGVVIFKSAGSQYEERTMGRRTVRVWRPGFSLNLRLVFISGRTGEMLRFAVVGTGDWSCDGRTDVGAGSVLWTHGQAHALGACRTGSSEQGQPCAIGREDWP
jgi:hypothetical protein